MSLGSLVAGVLFDSVGGSTTFRFYGMGALAFFIVHVVIQLVYNRFGSSSKNLHGK